MAITPYKSHSKTSSLAELVGRALREARISRGMTQLDLERAAGLKRSHISRIENGHRLPSLATLSRLAEAIGVPLHTLFLEFSVMQRSQMPAGLSAAPHATSGIKVQVLL